MLVKEKFKLKSETPSRNSSQEWWTFQDPWGNVEVVLRNWKYTDNRHIQGDEYFVEILKSQGILDRPSSIDKEFLKQYYEQLDKAQTKVVRKRALTDFL